VCVCVCVCARAQEWDAAFMNLDLDVAEENRDFSFLVKDLVAKANKVHTDPLT